MTTDKYPFLSGAITQHFETIQKFTCAQKRHGGDKLYDRGLLRFNRLTTTTIGNSVTTFWLFFADTEESVDDEALALRENLPTHCVFFTYEDHTMNIVPDNPHSIKSLHIDMNIVDELSPLEDSIVGQGTIDLHWKLVLIPVPKTRILPSPRELFSLPTPRTPASPLLAAPRVMKSLNRKTSTQLNLKPRISTCPLPPLSAPVWSTWQCRPMLELIMMPRLEY